MPISPELRQAMAAVSQLQDGLGAAFDRSDRSEMDRLLTELAVAEACRNRLVQKEVQVAGRGGEVPSMREQVALALGMLHRPAPVAIVRELVAARFGGPVQANALTSLRRDEQRSWVSAHRPAAAGFGQSRPLYIVPALTFDRFIPVRAMLALSTWDLPTRILGPTSQRVDALDSLTCLVDALEHDPNAFWAPQVTRLVWRLARSVAGTIDSHDGVSRYQVRAAAQRELELIAAGDATARSQAAERARRELDDEGQLFGTSAGRATAEASRPPAAPSRRRPAP